MLENCDWDVLTFKADEIKAFAHPLRLAILDILAQGELCVCELMEQLTLEQAVISKHLRILKDAGLVMCRKDGLKMYYTLTCPCVTDLLNQITATLKAIANRRQIIFRRIQKL